MLSILKSPQYIIIGIVIAFLAYFYYDYTSVKNSNSEYASQIASQERTINSIQSRYDALNEDLERQERLLQDYMEELQDIRQDSEDVRKVLDEYQDEKVREVLDTVIPDDLRNILLNPVGKR